MGKREQRAEAAHARHVDTPVTTTPHRDTHDWRRHSVAEMGNVLEPRDIGLDIAKGLLGPTAAVGLDALIEELSNGASLSSVLFDATGVAAAQLVDWAAEHVPDELVDFIKLHPTHHMAAFALSQISTDDLRNLLGEISPTSITDIAYAMLRTGQMKRLAETIWDVQVEQVKALVEVLDINVVGLLFQAARDKANAYAREVLREAWPIGWGLEIEAEIGATFGIPFRTDVRWEVMATRKSEDVVELYRRGKLLAAFDTGASVGGYAGGSGMGLGAQAGVNFMAGVEGFVTQKFDFRVFEEDGFLSMLIAVVAGDVGVAGGLLGVLFSDALKKLNPDRYHRSTKFDVNGFARGSAGLEASARHSTTEFPGGGDNLEGGPDIGAKPKWYSPYSLLRMHMFGRLEAHVGFSYEMENGPMVLDPVTGEREPETSTVHISGEAGAMAGVMAKLPGVQLPLPNLDATLGVKLSLQFGKPTTPGGEPRPMGVTHSVFAKSGQMDLPTQAQSASEAELVFKGQPSLDKFADWETFRDSISSARVTKRVGISLLTGGMQRTLLKQKELSSLLTSKYGEKGARLEGYVDFAFEFTVDQMRELFTALRNLVGAFHSLPHLFHDVVHFFSTGKARPEVIKAFAAVVGSLGGSLKRANAHVQVGAVFAGGANLGVGAAKVRGHLAAGAMVTFDKDIHELIQHQLEGLRDIILDPGEAGSPVDLDESMMLPAADNDVLAD